jgi:mevalonate kinase
MNTSGGAGQGHGKVILLGEHSVVYGRPAIAAGIPRGCQARAAFADADALCVEPWGVRIEAARAETDPDRELLRRAFATLCERYASPRQAFEVQARMEIPGGAGLGGSAALSVAIVRAIDACLGRSSAPDELLEGSLAWERVFHGNPSGIDSAMAIRGGLAWYRRGQPLASIRVGRALRLVVANSGEHGSTKLMVESVARQHARDAVKADQIFDAIEALVVNAKSALETGDHPRLGQLMDLNQQLLNTLLLSTSKLEAMCQLSRSAGALGAKLTGGGGGGCMLALAADGASAASIESALSSAGFDAFVVEVSP